MNRRASGIANIPARIDQGLRAPLEKMKQVIEVGQGTRGDPLDRYLTIRDAMDAGIIERLRRNSRFINGDDLRPTGPDLRPVHPVAPTGFAVTGGFSHIFLQWDDPDSLYQGHAYTTIYRSTDNNLANAVAIAQSTSFLYADVGVQREITYYYWIAFTSLSGHEGPHNAAAGTEGSTAPDPALVLASLSEQIRETQLYRGLQDRLDLIDDPVDGLVQGLDNEISNRQQAAASLQQQIDGLIVASNVQIFYQPEEPTDEDASGPALVERSRWFDTDDNNHPYVYVDGTWKDARDLITLDIQANLSREIINRINADNAQVGRVDTLELTINDPVNGVAANASGLSAALSSIQTNSDGLTAHNGRLDELELTVFDADTGVGASAAAIATQALQIDAIGDDVAVQGQDISGLQAAIEHPASGVAASAAAIDQLQVDVAFIDGELQTQATALTQVQTESGENTTAVQVLQQSVDGLEGSFTVKIDSNGFVAGFGLAVTQNEYDGGQHSEMIFSVDRFSVGAPGATELTFIIDGNRVVMDGALIKNATISTAQVGEIAVDKIVGISAAFLLAKLGTASITNAYIGSIIESTTYSVSGGNEGWRINKNGTAVFNNIFARGNIEADRLKANAVNIVDTLHLKGNAVTIAQSVSASNANLTFDGASVKVASTSFNPEGGGYHILFSGEFYHNRDSLALVEIWVNGRRRRVSNVGLRADGGSDITSAIPVAVSWGSSSSSTVTVDIWVKKGGRAGAHLQNGNLLILGAKR